ncbi:Molybdenum transport protein ModE [Sterolibacterium denitrificans]|uniref:Molybdenum transport protein ModE n=1 Tax=Sterolibacterium denitrificans TaxID=157592 RepID=A0A7Z7HPM4_9PROT|nr:TOBE domain-containing protein [Sterolibacterium denitrificans]SMB22690.1 Molybdenum transport protein ModE [Sterolibacterium denitrificans]
MRKASAKHKEGQDLAVHGSIWLTMAGENFGGAGRVDLLARIAEYGSISQAAKSIKMSYKAAWDAIDAMNNLAGEPLVERLTGGKGGGGTRLTQRGERLVANFRIIEREHRQFIEQLSRQAEGITHDFLLIRRMNMKTSARNQFLGQVTAIRPGSINDEIELAIPGGLTLTAILTHASRDSLDLRLGSEAFALVKASSIIVVTDEQKAGFSARNRISGRISRLQIGAVNSEVIIELPAGGSIAAVITNESCHALALAVGQTASAIFKASSVIVGVPA